MRFHRANCYIISIINVDKIGCRGKSTANRHPAARAKGNNRPHICAQVADAGPDDDALALRE